MPDAGTVAVPRLPYPLRNPLGEFTDLLVHECQRSFDQPDAVVVLDLCCFYDPVQVHTALGPRDVVRPDMHPWLKVFKPRHLAFVSVLGRLEVLRFKTRFVNPLGPARSLQRLVGLIRPVLAGLLQPVAGLGGRAFPRSPPSPGPARCIA